MKLEITKERILEAASKCSTAKETLKTLFPEVFEDDKYFYFSSTMFHVNNLPKGFQGLELRVGGEYNLKGFYLPSQHNWQIVEDEFKQLVLLPTRKV